MKNALAGQVRRMSCAALARPCVTALPGNHKTPGRYPLYEQFEFAEPRAAGVAR